MTDGAAIHDYSGLDLDRLLASPGAWEWTLLAFARFLCVAVVADTAVAVAWGLSLGPLALAVVTVVEVVLFAPVVPAVLAYLGIVRGLARKGRGCSRQTAVALSPVIPLGSLAVTLLQGSWSLCDVVWGFGPTSPGIVVALVSLVFGATVDLRSITAAERATPPVIGATARSGRGVGRAA